GQCFSPVAARRLLLPGQLLSSLSAAALALSPDRNSARPVVQTRRSHTPDRPLRSLSPRHRLALSEPVPFRRARRQQQLTRFLTSEPDSPQAVSAEPCAKSPALCSRSSFVSHPPLRPLDSAIPRHPDHTFRSSDELSRLGREFKLWLKRRRLTKEQLGRIQEMDETELLSTLPVVFAKDLSACVPISKTQRIILLFDSHEAFWGVEQRIYFPEERRQEFDDWFRALLKTLNR